jgi:hypothetical protein
VTVYLDENLSPDIAGILRRRGVDAISTYELGNVQLDDRAQLEYATREGRAIVTANVADFLALSREAVRTNTEHAGIILIPSSFRGDEFQAIADGVAEMLEQHPKSLGGSVNPTKIKVAPSILASKSVTEVLPPCHGVITDVTN